ncbi:MAG: trigger factor [Acidobacteria bacterium]|nr:trigger factor [Acidobacteriota bacterium]
MKLEVAVADITQSKKDLTIEVPADEVQIEFEKTYDAFMRNVKLPGFRPGRVPRGMIKQRFTKEVTQEVINQLIPHALQHAIHDKKLRVISEPQINEVTVNEGQPLRFTASVEVMPEFEVKEYKGLKVSKWIHPATEQELESVLAHLRESAAEFVPIEDRPAQDGDFVSFNLLGRFVHSGQENDSWHDPGGNNDLAIEDNLLELGTDQLIPEFHENLRGVQAGDLREFRTALPEDFSEKNLAGKTIDFRLTVMAVRKKELPELDDDFAREAGEFQTLHEMKEKISERLQEDSLQKAESEMREELMKQIVSAYDFELPPSLVERETEHRLQQLANHLLRSGIPRESLQQVDWDQRYQEAQAQVSHESRLALVMDRIAELEGIVVTNEMVDAEVARVAARSGETFEQLKARLTKIDTLSSIENRLRFEMALEAVVSKAEVTVEYEQSSSTSSPDGS